MQEDYRKEDEIDLLELLQVLWRRKVLIIGGTLLVAALGVAVVLLLPPTYEVTAILEPGRRPISDQNGQIVEEKVIESAVAIRETVLGGAYDEHLMETLGITESRFPELNVEVPKNTDLVKISVENSDPVLAAKVVAGVIELISEGMAEKIDRERQRIQNEIRLAEIDVQENSTRLDLLRAQIESTQGIIGSLQAEKQKNYSRNRSDAMAVLLYGNEIQNQQIYLNKLQTDLQKIAAEGQKAQAKLENQQRRLKAVQAMILYKSPTIPELPVKPRKTLIVALAGCIGLFLTCLLAFLLEALRARAQENISARPAASFRMKDQKDPVITSPETSP